MNFFRRREALALRFEQREGIFLPQTAGIWALHADVCFRGIAPGKQITIVDAYLDWRSSARRKAQTLAMVRWDRVAIDGHFRYPVEPLALTIGPSPGLEATLTFDAGLLRVPSTAPTSGSVLRLRLSTSGNAQVIERDLWRIETENWSAGRATMTWLVPAR